MLDGERTVVHPVFLNAKGLNPKGSRGGILTYVYHAYFNINFIANSKAKGVGGAMAPATPSSFSAPLQKDYRALA